MKFILWIIVVIMALICSALAQTGRPEPSTEVVVTMSSSEETAIAHMLSILAADEDDADEQRMAKSYLDTQMGFDPNEQDPKVKAEDEKEKAKIRSAVKRYLQGDETTEGIKALNAEWEKHIPNDREREAHQLEVLAKIKKLQQETARAFHGKAYFKVKKLENTILEKEN